VRRTARFARSGRLRIGYEVHAGLLRRRRPWLLLAQGLGFDRHGWEPVVPALRRRFRLVLFDNRGSGVSDGPGGRFSVADVARDAVAVLDAAGISRAHVLGVSLGGMVAQEIAIGHPDRVDRLVLACTTPGRPAGYPMPRESVRLMAATPGLPRDAALRRNVENALARRTAAEEPALVDRLVRHQAARPPDPRGFAALASAGARFRGGGRQAAITAPTLVLQGTADTVVDPRNAAVLAGLIPDADLLMLPGLGHLFFWERPEALTALVTPFLLGRPIPPDVVQTWAAGTATTGGGSDGDGRRAGSAQAGRVHPDATADG
jgi:pimeloyl-ACP methyl ester carboxylesterase